MPDIFLSYSREDQRIARRFAEGLQHEGFGVWWDQSLNAGEAFDQVTEKALDDARAVVVLWSKKSVDSRWVRAEATQAQASHRLVPVMIEPCKRPIMFELTHTADLLGWNGDKGDPRWRTFIEGLGQLAGSKGADGRPVASVAPDVVAGKAIAERPGGRRGLAIGIAAALLAGGGLLWMISGRDRPPTPMAGATAPSSTPAAPATQAGVTLAVLPFANLSSDPEQEYFSDGLTEEILNQLAQIPALRLTGRTSSFSFKGKNEDLRVIGEKLGVANILEGSVRKDDGQLRITAQLIRADDGTHMWSKTYDRDESHVFAVQDEIARDVAQALSVKLDVTTFNRAQGGTTNVEAYDRYLKWRNLELSERRGIEVDQRQLQLLREAVALDPQFALAWDELARMLDRISRFSTGATAERLKADAELARERVTALAPDSWMVQRARAYSLWGEGKWPEAIAVAKAIRDKGPFTREHVYPYSDVIFSVGRIEEVVALVEQVKAIEPLAMFLSRDQQLNLTAVGRIEEAEAEYQRSKSLDGSHAAPDSFAFMRLLAREDADPQARRALHRQLLEQWGSQAPSFFRELGPQLHDRSAMRAILRRSFEARPEPLIALYADALGDAELSLEVMRTMWKGPSPNYALYWGLFLAPHSGMRSLPGYKELMREVGLVDYWRSTGDWGDICKPVGEDDFECR